MKLPIISNRIRRLAELDMPAQAVQSLLLDLAAELDAEETRLSKERNRKSPDIPRKQPENSGISVEIQPSRVLDNITLSTSNKEVRKKDLTPIVPLFSETSFEEFWTVYPKRTGAADKKSAAKAFRAACNRTAPEAIITGARIYSSHCKFTSKWGTELRSPLVYGCLGLLKMSSTDPSSTIRPAYITATSLQVSATTPKSWVMSIIAV